MFRTILRGVQVAGAVLALSLATPAAAQPADPAKQAAAEAVAQFLLSAVDFGALVSSGLGSAFAGMEEARPEWDPMLKQAFVEQLAKDRPFMTAILARQFLVAYSREELLAGAALMADPALRMAMTSQDGSARPSAETRRVMSSPSGKAFLAKMGSFDDLMGPVKNEFISGLIPGVFQRFGATAQAAEVRRRAANGLPPPLAD